MKKFSKLFVLMTLLFGYLLPTVQTVFANNPVNTNVTIHKIKMDDVSGWPKPQNPDGTYPGETGSTSYDGSEIGNIQQYFGGTATELNGVNFTYWKITEDQYKAMTAAPASYDTEKEVKDYLVNNTEPKGTVKTEGGNGAKINGLETGYYWFIEDYASVLTDLNPAGQTIAAAAAVPFGLALPVYKSTGEPLTDLHVYPKNTTNKPEIDKNFDKSVTDAPTAVKGADYQKYQETKDTINRTIGTSVPYNVKTKIPKDARYQTVRWDDTMTSGLTFDKNLRVTFNGTTTVFDQTDYEIKQNDSGFVLKFTDAGLVKLETAAKVGEFEIELNYSATINEDAVIDSPEENNITFNYGNKPKEFKDPRNNSVTPKNKSVKVKKNWAGGQTAPANVKVTYFLYEIGADETKDKVVSSKTLNGPTYDHTFDNLEESKKYYVKEFVSGYDPSYAVTNDDGTITVTNTQDPHNPPPLVPTTPKVVTHGKKFVKRENNDTGKTLSGAKFVVKQGAKYLALKDTATQQELTEYNEKQTAYLEALKKQQEELAKVTPQDANTTAIEQAKAKVAQLHTERDAAYVALNMEWKWADTENEGFVFTSDKDGNFEVKGLAEGQYELIETEAPTGYAKLTNPVVFNVTKTSYSTPTEIQNVINKKITIPQTGGMGTVIFTVVGAGIMLFAFVAMRRKQKSEK